MPSEKMILRSYRIPEDLCDEIRTASVRQRTSEADVVRDALRLYFSADSRSPDVEKIVQAVVDRLPAGRGSIADDATLSDVSGALGGILAALRAMDERITRLGKTQEKEMQELIQAVGRHLLTQTEEQKQVGEAIARAFMATDKRVKDLLDLLQKSRKAQ